tara:strand:+ start:37 stop:417 length:381 start_codon:yes stop_codon:yes gene_type:complete
MENNITPPQEATEHSTIGIVSLVGTLISAVISFYGFFKAVSLGVQAAQTAQTTGIEPQMDEATTMKLGMIMLVGGFGAFTSAVVAAISVIKDKGAKKISTAIAALVISGLGILGLILIMILGALAG